MPNTKQTPDESLLAQERKRFHKELLETTLSQTDGATSNADKESQESIEVANRIAQSLCNKVGVPLRQIPKRISGQSLGKFFEKACESYLSRTFLELSHIRPGRWTITREISRSKVDGRKPPALGKFVQYGHLDTLASLTQSDSELLAALGNDYMIKPDTIIFRHGMLDAEINSIRHIVGAEEAKAADLRVEVGGRPFLHASVSSKWTLRSDRAQNARSEALNLIRNRKGRLPHIVLVTAEPLVSRISSLGLGTGDIDCIYHFALYELQAAVEKPEAREVLEAMVSGRRLKDISDLPLDLAV